MKTSYIYTILIKKVVHTSTRKSPFETCFGYFPQSPLDIEYGQHVGVREDFMRDGLKEEKNVENIKKIHL